MKKRGESPQNCVWEMNVFVAVTLEYWRILKQKRELKTRVQLPRDWFGTSIWPSWARVTIFVFRRREGRVFNRWGKGRPWNDNSPTPRSAHPPPPTPPPSKKNRNEKNTHLCVFQEDVEYVWVRAHVVLARTVSKDEIQASGLWRGECLKTIQALWSARHPAALLHSLIASCRFSDPKLS